MGIHNKLMYLMVSIGKQDLLAFIKTVSFSLIAAVILMRNEESIYQHSLTTHLQVLLVLVKKLPDRISVVRQRQCSQSGLGEDELH